MEKPNILLITTDQQRFDALGAAGNSIIQTPNMDRLASEGILFENAISPSPLCVPARASLISGYACGHIGGLGNDGVSYLEENDTMATSLSRAGYHTQAIGKMHFMPCPPYKVRYGMDHMILSEEMRGVRWAHSPDEILFDDYDKYLIKNNAWGWEKPPEIGYNEIKPLINLLPPELHITRWCGETTSNWLKYDRPKGKPFFLWSSFVKPHVPYDCPSHLADLYDPDNMPEPWNGDATGEGQYPGFKAKRRYLEFDLYSKEAVRRSRAYYYANITFVDTEIGRILDTLEDEGLIENTLIVFTSDHGDLLGDHGQWYKSVGYEGSLRIPLILRWPENIKPGTRNSDIVNLTDIYPTVMKAAGLNPGEGRPGEDLKEFAQGNIHRDFSVSELGHPPNAHIHLRHKKWKYLWYQNGGFEELYNLENDPRELNNLSGKSEYKKILEDLKESALIWIKKWSRSDIYLNDNGKFLEFPYSETQVEKADWSDSPQPFSRMPWDSRIPPYLLNKNQKSWWWDNTGSDWSSLIVNVLGKKSK